MRSVRRGIVWLEACEILQFLDISPPFALR
jgi:hypothetical protein